MEYVHQYLKNKIFVGLVEENLDPFRMGRIKVRVQSLYDDLKVEEIPWASPYSMSVSGKMYDLPQIGKIVSVIFVNDILYEPYYINADHFNVNLQKKLESYDDDEYKSFVALLFDHRTQVFSDNKELTLDYKLNKIRITNNNINIDLKDNNQKINLGGDNATQQVVFGNHWLDWFDDFVNTILKPTSLIDSTGKSVLKPELEEKLREYKRLRNTFLSKNVYLVDNKQIEKKYRVPESKAIEHDFVKINKDVSNFDSFYKKRVLEQYERNNNELKNSIPTSIIEITEDISPAIDADGSGSYVVDNVKKSTEELSDIRVVFSGDTISDDEQIVTGNMIIDENGEKKYMTQEDVDEYKKEESIEYGIPQEGDYSPDDLLYEDGMMQYFENDYSGYEEGDDIIYTPATDEEFEEFIKSRKNDSQGNVYVPNDYIPAKGSSIPFIKNYSISNVDGYIFPIYNVTEKIILTSPYGPRNIKESKNKFHAGIDFGYTKLYVVAIEKGKVTKIHNSYSKAGGMYVEITHDNGLISFYCHLDSISVTLNQFVSKGDSIGISGASGGNEREKYRYHLHFAISKMVGGKKTYFNPMDIIYKKHTFLTKFVRKGIKSGKVYTGEEIVNGWDAGNYVYTTVSQFERDVKNGVTTV